MAHESYAFGYLAKIMSCHPRFTDYANILSVMSSDQDRYPISQPALNTCPENALRINSRERDLDKAALERFKVWTMCEGWGIYQDTGSSFM